MSTYLKNAIWENANNLVNIERRTVEPTKAAMEQLSIAYAEDGDNPEDLMFQEGPVRWWEVFHADMMRVFAGQMKPDFFFEKYRGHYNDLLWRIEEDYNDAIWNISADALDIPPVDIYAEVGHKRSDF